MNHNEATQCVSCGMNTRLPVSFCHRRRNMPKVTSNDMALPSTASAARRNYWILLCLHSLLIAIHAILVAVIYAPPGHLEHRVSIPLGQANVLQVGIVVISQLFSVIFVASALFIIQQLALRKAYHTRQTLKAVHDTYTAWGGLGSALLTLCLRTSSVWGITAYLLGTSVIQITTPSLFTLTTSNNTRPGYVEVTPYTPEFQYFSSHKYLDGAAYVLPLLSLLANTTTGLHRNIIFDVVGEARDSATHDIRSISTEIQVNATAFHVTCGLLPQARQNATQANTTVVWNIITPLGDISPGFDVSPIRLLARYGIRFLPHVWDPSSGLTRTQSALLYASVNITDDQGRNGTTLQLNPPMPGVPDNIDTETDLYPDFQPVIVACNLNQTLHKVFVDPISRNITAGSVPERTVQTVWQDWQAPPLSDDFLLASWGSIFNIRTLTATRARMCTTLQPLGGDICQAFDYLTLAEKFLNDRLGIRPASVPSWATRKVVHLQDLQMALEEMTAAVYWSVVHTPYSSEVASQYNPINLPKGYNMEVQVSNPNVQLNLNAIPVFFGLSSSIVLLVLAIMITREADRSTLDSELDMMGLLQLMWLLGKGSKAQARIAEVEKPTVDNLRLAALFDVRLETLVRRRRGQYMDEGDL